MTFDLLIELEEQILFQRRWKRIMSAAYFCASALAILLGFGATIIAALGHSTQASFLAGGATALYGIEKALLLREKWAHHLSSEMELRSLKLEYSSGAIEQCDAAKEMARILKGYAVGLPIAPARE